MKGFATYVKILVLVRNYFYILERSNVINKIYEQL